MSLRRTMNERNESKGSTTVGIGFSGLLQIAFIVLKLCKVIDWSWWCVMLPTIIPLGLFVLALLFFAWLWRGD